MVDAGLGTAEAEYWVGTVTAAHATVTVTTTSTDQWVAQAYEVSGGVQNIISGGSATGTSGTTYALTVSGLSSTNLVFAFLNTLGNYNTSAPTAPWTNYNAGYFVHGNGLGVAYQSVNGASVTATWVGTALGAYAIVGVILTQGTSGTATPLAAPGTGAGVTPTPQVSVAPGAAPATGAGTTPSANALIVRPLPALGVGGGPLGLGTDSPIMRVSFVPGRLLLVPGSQAPPPSANPTPPAAAATGVGIQPTVTSGSGGLPPTAPGVGAGVTPTITVSITLTEADGAGVGGPIIFEGANPTPLPAQGTGSGLTPLFASPAEGAFDGLCIFVTPQVRDRPPYLPNSSPAQVGLMRHFENRLRGVLVWLRNDGTYVVDTTCNYEAAMTEPAAYITTDVIGPDLTADFQGLTDSNVNYPWNPFPGSTNSNIPGSYAYNVNWDRTTQDFILNPYLIQWWEGGAENVITQAQALALTQAGFGDCIRPAGPHAVLGSQPQGQGPYGSEAINA